MKWSLEDVAESCERALADEKSGSRERSILSLAAKNIRRALKDTRSAKEPVPQSSSVTPLRPSAPLTREKDAPDTEPPIVPTPERARLSADGSPTREPGTATDPSLPAATPLPAHTPGSRGASAPAADSTTSPDQFATNADELNCLAYAAAISIVGESGSHYGAISRGSSKALMSSLELVALLLNNPLVPTDFASPLPSFEFSKKDSHGAAQVFFSKLLGGSSQGAAKLSTRSPAESVAAGPPQQVRLLLVDAVLAASDVIRARDTTDKLWFVYLTALSAATVPQRSRVRVSDTTTDCMRTDYLCLHDERLGKVLEFLFGTLSLPEANPFLIDAAKTIMQRITKALSNYVEQRNPLTAKAPLDTAKSRTARDTQSVVVVPSLSTTTNTNLDGESGNKSVSGELAHSTTNSSVPSPASKGVNDMQRALRLCAAIITNVSVTMTSAGPNTMTGGSSNSTNNSSSTGTAGTLMSVAATAEVADGAAVYGGQASQSYIAVTTALGALLSFIVNGGPAFRNSDAIAQVIRQSILPATMRLSLSPDIDLFRLSLNVILYSCFRFSGSLVSETGTVFRHVYFRVLSSKYAALTQKLLVLDVFQRYIEEPQNLIGLFLNYDCNTYSQSIYEEMIQYLAALAFPWPMRQASANANPVIKELYSSLAVKLEYDVDDALRQRAMEQLVMVADSNIQWIERFVDDSAIVGAAAGNVGSGDGQNTDSSADALRAGNSIAIEEAHDAGTGVVASSQDAFLQARRYKDTFKKFLYMFNEKGSAEAAIEFLRSSVLFEGISSVSTSTEVKTATSSEAHSRRAPPHVEDAVDAPAAADDAAVAVEDTEGASSSSPPPPPPPDVSEAGDPSAATVPDAELPTAALPRDASEDSFDGVVEDAAMVDAHKVAVFLRRNEDYLDKLALGDYFAKSFRKQTTRLVFEAWIQLHNFSGMTLDEALRLFLGGFKLLGEAQVVDKTMELFASQYCRQNPTVFRAADTAFILSFSICMLNTDAHSAHIKNKMSLEGFIKNNAGIDDGMDVSPDILAGIYHRITQEEIVLRPSPYCPSFNAKTHSAGGSDSAGAGQKKATAGVLRSVPILRNLIPLASAITDKVALPMDMFNSAERKREELYQAELTAALKDIMTVVQSSEATLPDGSSRVHLVMASRIEHAIPMWEVTVSPVCNLLIASLVRFFEDAEAYTPIANPGTTASASGNSSGGTVSVSTGGGIGANPIMLGGASVGVPALAFGHCAGAGLPGNGGSGEALSPSTRASCFLEEKPAQRQFMTVLLHGLDSVMKVCCSFGNVMHTEMVVEHCFELTQLSQTVVCSGLPAPHVTVTQALSAPRLALIVSLLNLFLAHGTSLTSPSWQFCYNTLSLLDASANGVDGVFRRKSKKLLQSSSSSTATPAPQGAATSAASAPKAPPPDMWFGDLLDVPESVSRSCAANRQSLLGGLRRAPGSAVDLWLERLFDATRYPFTTQVHMANGLAPVAAKELQTERVFSLTKLFDFVSSCASLSSRLQWRELWSHARAVFVMAGRMNDTIANSTLDGLRIIALTYLMREELFNYSFQKEVLKPFEDILMSNQSVPVRMHIIRIVSELVEFRASSLASGWSVVFSCLSHAAVIPEIVASAWEACEKIITTQLVQVKDYFSEFVFCLTTFACTNMEEKIALMGISYLVACGHWLVYGLETPPADVRSAAEVVLWACRFDSADAEAHAAHTGARHLTRVTVAADVLSSEAPLKKPTSYAVKTAYQVWMSLFEGLVPVVVIQASVRVRIHAINCIWTLVKVYGSAFDADVQDSLFSGMLRPMLITVANHLPPTAPTAIAESSTASASAPPSATPSAPPPPPPPSAMPSSSLSSSRASTGSRAHEMDRTDYNILTGVSFHGMLSACLTHPHLLKLACATLVHFSATTALSRTAMVNDLVSALLGVCVDLLSAGCTPATLDFFWCAALRDEEAASGLTDARLLLRRVAAQCASPSATSVAGVAGAEWLSLCSAFAVGMLHEVLQLGRVDVVRLRRTAAWAELHSSPVARTRVMALTGLCRALPEAAQTETRSLLRDTAMRAVSSLYGQLMARLQTDHRQRDTCLAASRDARRCLLVASFFTLVTRDRQCFQFVLQPVLSQTMPLSPSQPLPTAVPATETSGAAVTAAVSTTTTTPQEDAAVPAVELLFLIPYTVVMLEFVVNCGHAQQLVEAASSSPALCVVAGDTHCSVEDMRRSMHAVSARLASDLKDSRQYCLDAQRAIREYMAEEAAKGGSQATVRGKRFKAYKGRGFMDIFRTARAPLSERVQHFCYESASPELLRRIFFEWRYLLDVVALNFALERFLDSTTPTRTGQPPAAEPEDSHQLPWSVLDMIGAVDLVPFLPSELEESAAEPFLQSCWDELNTHATLSSVSTAGMVVEVIDRRLRAGTPRASPDSAPRQVAVPTQGQLRDDGNAAHAVDKTRAVLPVIDPTNTIVEEATPALVHQTPLPPTDDKIADYWDMTHEATADQVVAYEVTDHEAADDQVAEHEAAENQYASHQVTEHVAADDEVVGDGIAHGELAEHETSGGGVPEYEIDEPVAADHVVVEHEPAENETAEHVVNEDAPPVVAPPLSPTLPDDTDAEAPRTPLSEASHNSYSAGHDESAGEGFYVTPHPSYYD